MLIEKQLQGSWWIKFLAQQWLIKYKLIVIMIILIVINWIQLNINYGNFDSD